MPAAGTTNGSLNGIGTVNRFRREIFLHRFMYQKDRWVLYLHQDGLKHIYVMTEFVLIELYCVASPLLCEIDQNR